MYIYNIHKSGNAIAGSKGRIASNHKRTAGSGLHTKIFEPTCSVIKGKGTDTLRNMNLGKSMLKKPVYVNF